MYPYIGTICLFGIVVAFWATMPTERKNRCRMCHSKHLHPWECICRKCAKDL